MAAAPASSPACSITPTMFKIGRASRSRRAPELAAAERRGSLDETPRLVRGVSVFRAGRLADRVPGMARRTSGPSRRRTACRARSINTSSSGRRRWIATVASKSALRAPLPSRRPRNPSSISSTPAPTMWMLTTPPSPTQTSFMMVLFVPGECRQHRPEAGAVHANRIAVQATRPPAQPHGRQQRRDARTRPSARSRSPAGLVCRTGGPPAGDLRSDSATGVNAQAIETRRRLHTRRRRSCSAPRRLTYPCWSFRMPAVLSASASLLGFRPRRPQQFVEATHLLLRRRASAARSCRPRDGARRCRVVRIRRSTLRARGTARPNTATVFIERLQQAATHEQAGFHTESACSTPASLTAI